MKKENAHRFTGLADIYAENRPSYPPEVMARLAAAASAEEVPRLALDVGCGTGISTRALNAALNDWSIIAAEPNDDMRAKAEAGCRDLDRVTFVAAGAEALPAGPGEVGLIVAAQALHWFDLDAFFREAARVLAPGAVLAVLYNNRQNGDAAVLADIETELEGIDPTYSRNYRARDIPALLSARPELTSVERFRQRWSRPSSIADLVNYFMSRSMLQPLAEQVGEGALRQRIERIASRHARDGLIDVPMATELDWARRR